MNGLGFITHWNSISYFFPQGGAVCSIKRLLNNVLFFFYYSLDSWYISFYYMPFFLFVCLFSLPSFWPPDLLDLFSILEETHKIFRVVCFLIFSSHHLSLPNCTGKPSFEFFLKDITYLLHFHLLCLSFIIARFIWQTLIHLVSNFPFFCFLFFSRCLFSIFESLDFKLVFFFNNCFMEIYWHRIN